MCRSLFCAAFLFVVVTAVSGCMQDARVIRNDAKSGVVVIPSNTDRWPTYYRRQAEDAIRQEHGQNVEIIWGKGEERVIGQETRNEQVVDRRFLGNEDKPKGEVVKNTNTSTTMDKKEYALQYEVRPIGASSGAPNGGIIQAGGVTKPSGQIPSSGQQTNAPARQGRIPASTNPAPTSGFSIPSNGAR